MFGRGDFVCTLSRWDCEEGPAPRSEGLTCHCTRDAGALAIISLETSAKLHEGHTEALSDRNMMGELRCNWITLRSSETFLTRKNIQKANFCTKPKRKKTSTFQADNSGFFLHLHHPTHKTPTTSPNAFHSRAQPDVRSLQINPQTNHLLTRPPVRSSPP